MKFATFDLETANPFPDDGNWRAVGSLGISCAALAVSDQSEPRYFEGKPQMNRAACVEMVRVLQQVVADGYTLVTWNGTAFDFDVLARESDLPRECAQLALEHVDLMVIVTFKRGHYLALQKALLGAGIQGKKKHVILNDGSPLSEMSGKLAPELWAKGEYTAVLSYLREDVMPLLKLAEFVRNTKQIRWTSTKGRASWCDIQRLWTVRECFDFPLPDTSWMTMDPPQREKFVEWMPPLNDVIPGAIYNDRNLRELPLFAYAADSPYWREFRSGLLS